MRIIPGPKINLLEVEKLLLCPWATRIWTLQEVLLAEKPTIWTGDQTLDWRSLMYSITFFDHARRKLHCNNLDAICTTWTLIFEVWLSNCGNPDPQSDSDDTKRRRLLRISRDRYLRFMEQVLAYYELFSHMLLGPSVIGFVLVFLIGYFACQKEDVGFQSQYVTENSCQSPQATTTAVILIVIILLFLYLYATTVMGTNTADIRLKLGMFLGQRRYESRDEAVDSDIVQNYLIRQVRARKATNPRDKLFGLQCVLERLSYPLDLPKYADSEAQVFKSLFLTLLSKTQYWDLLLCRKFQTLDGPSWVPNWSNDLENHWLHHDHVFKTVDAVALGQHLSHCQPPGKDWSPRILGNQDQLLVYGFKLGKVETWSPKLVRTRREFQDEDDRGHQHNIEVILGFLNKLIVCKDRRSPRTARQLPTPELGAQTPDTKQKEHPVVRYEIPHQLFTKKSDYRHPSYRDKSPFYQQYQSWLSALYDIREIGPANRLSALRSKLGKRLDYHAELCDDMAMCNRRFFATETDIHGNGPAEMEVGDEIVQVWGVSQPLVLRQSLLDGDRYRLVGFVNVYGEVCRDGRLDGDDNGDGGRELTHPIEFVIE